MQLEHFSDSRMPATCNHIWVCLSAPVAITPLWRWLYPSISIYIYLSIYLSFYLSICFAMEGTAWKESKYGVTSGLYFPVFGLNTEIYSANLRIQSKYRKIWTRNNSVFGHFSRSEFYKWPQIYSEYYKERHIFTKKLHRRCLIWS